VNKPAWRWIREDIVLSIHAAQIDEHGGLNGVRDLALVQSALARPQNLADYSDPDAASLAASYAYGLSRNHGFFDGNKRTAYVVALVFLLMNGWETTASDIESATTMQALAAGKIDEPTLAEWFRRNIAAIR
jgi:death-on-curing protein